MASPKNVKRPYLNQDCIIDLKKGKQEEKEKKRAILSKLIERGLLKKITKIVDIYCLVGLKWVKGLFIPILAYPMKALSSTTSL